MVIDVFSGKHIYKNYTIRDTFGLTSLILWRVRPNVGLSLRFPHLKVSTPIVNSNKNWAYLLIIKQKKFTRYILQVKKNSSTL